MSNQPTTWTESKRKTEDMTEAGSWSSVQLIWSKKKNWQFVEGEALNTVSILRGVARWLKEWGRRKREQRLSWEKRKQPGPNLNKGTECGNQATLIRAMFWIMKILFYPVPCHQVDIKRNVLRTIGGITINSGSDIHVPQWGLTSWRWVTKKNKEEWNLGWLNTRQAAANRFQ